ncbi:MAG: type II toxin-antitoxin system VapC family toxin [Actinobacteria bacterium]|nr:MAG: type II toxin-antitoxin system VapC family toxin [Actinomycetota bacterium]
MALLLDTTVLIDALRGRPAAERVLALRDSAQVPWICAVNAEEVLRGAGGDSEQLVMRFLGGLQVAPLGREEGVRAGRWRRDYARRGIALSQADCLIAAAAVGVGARLATGNPRHFPMSELDVEDWPVGA